MQRLARQFVLQAAAVFLAFSIAWPFYALRVAEWNGAAVALLAGGSAFLLARYAREPWWWQAIHLCFSPLVWLGLQLPISPLWHLLAFFLLFLIFRGALSEQVPLYLSGARILAPLAALLPERARVLDIGAGIGSLLLPLSRMRPDLHLSGIDNAPLPWLIGRLRVPGSGITWRWGNFRGHSLDGYQAVYCFLSPAPMQALWEKACREMTPGSLFISKAFPIPGRMPDMLAGRGEDTIDTLYVYRIPHRVAVSIRVFAPVSG
ncbi:MAG: class I SAM-dependent methyltransferase [Zoogloeaceae bacterium]|jgi:hypothetical protein|nr:class I SAM-dependent methyltransferase [Zoogloeaceae bacterium]